MEATKAIEAKLYKDGRTVQKLLGLGMDNKGSADGSSSRGSRYDPRSEREKFATETRW